ncbi:DoxX family protein [uncultured Corynebacterium sp.]|uniref:DoxX family protein n=1 Tax=uncultured Corynebacterium sp. TaxID=159447 RepID=UPI0025CFF26B|nr:DoxX family protein [uncultured Corynebacterium sp.]
MPSVVGSNTLSRTTSDIVILIARVAVGVILFAHGWQKFFTNTIDGTSAFFASADVPAATASAIFAATVELVGGALLVVGLFTPVVGVLVVIDMLGAWWFVHSDAGTIFVDGGGYELVLALAAGAALVGAVGGGRFSLDHLFSARRGNA